MVRHFPGLAFSGPVIFVVLHFQVLRFQRPLENVDFHGLWTLRLRHLRK